MYTDKDDYFLNEDIVVTAYGGDGAWVGLYYDGDDPTATQSVCWYYLQKHTHLVGQSYILQRTAEYNKPKTLAAGKYKLVLFSGESNTTAVAEKEITLSDGAVGEAQAPVKADYTPDDSESGVASGSLTLEMGENNGYASEVVACWADDGGELEEYLPFAPFKVYANKIKFNVLDNVIIPEAATKLRFYGKNVNGLGETFLDVPVKAVKNESKLLYSFNVVSDIHISTDSVGKVYNAHFENALKDVAENSPESKGLFVVGDIANAGRSAEWKLAQQLIDGTDGAPQVYFTLGNHDLYDNNVPYDTKIQDFLYYTGEEKAYYEVEIKGTSHLILGSQEQVSGGLDCIFRNDQLEWLENRLEELTAANPSKPVFLYNHQSVYATIAGSLKGQNWNGIQPNDKFKEILKKYPQVLFFNGHSHWVMDSYRNAYFASNEMPNAFNTSSVAYLWSTTDKEIEVAGSQGYFVDVYRDKVCVYGKDFTSKKLVPSACYAILNK